jgi:hypothetical protein
VTNRTLALRLLCSASVPSVDVVYYLPPMNPTLRKYIDREAIYAQ